MNKKNKLWQAAGYSFINDDIPCGYVGDVHPMKTWIMKLYGDKGLEYFAGWSDKEVADYIYKNAGYRLVVYK